MLHERVSGCFKKTEGTLMLDPFHEIDKKDGARVRISLATFMYSGLYSCMTMLAYFYKVCSQATRSFLCAHCVCFFICLAASAFVKSLTSSYYSQVCVAQLTFEGNSHEGCRSPTGVGSR